MCWSPKLSVNFVPALRLTRKDGEPLHEYLRRRALYLQNKADEWKALVPIQTFELLEVGCRCHASGLVHTKYFVPRQSSPRPLPSGAMESVGTSGTGGRWRRIAHNGNDSLSTSRERRC